MKIPKYCAKYHGIPSHFLSVKFFHKLKRNAQFIFLCNPQKPSVNVCPKKILKSTVTKNLIVCFYNLGEENF